MQARMLDDEEVGAVMFILQAGTLSPEGVIADATPVATFDTPGQAIYYLLKYLRRNFSSRGFDETHVRWWGQNPSDPVRTGFSISPAT